jgi:hypothetical protein
MLVAHHPLMLASAELKFQRKLRFLIRIAHAFGLAF